jgi:hypothetical protein
MFANKLKLAINYTLVCKSVKLHLSSHEAKENVETERALEQKAEMYI